MLIELLLASCMYVDTNSTQMTCTYHRSVWRYANTIMSFYPEPSNHYIGSVCWVLDDNHRRTLIAEKCEEFAKRLK